MKIWPKIKEFLNNKNNSNYYEGFWSDAKPVVSNKSTAMLWTCNTSPTTNTYIKIRTEFEGYHFYPGASTIDPRIKFLETEHRHIFKVEVKISVTHLDRELEFFLTKWALADYIKSGKMNHKSCEMIATDILQNHLIPKYGKNRYYEIVVSEDGENDGVVEYKP